MKKIITLAFLSVLCTQGFSQLVQASIGAGNQPSSFKVYLKSDIDLSNPNDNGNNISTLQFDIAIPDIPGSIPNLNITTSNILNVDNWKGQPSFVKNGRRHYMFLTDQVGYDSPLQANIEFEAWELQFSGGPQVASDVYLITLGDGGDVGDPNGGNGNALFLYTSIKGNSNAADINGLYYVRQGTEVNNNFNSYVNPGNVADESWARINNVLLPVKFTGFEATKNGNNTANLKWSVESETATTDRYEVESSANGVDFAKLTTVSADVKPNGSNTYTLNNVNLTSNITYFRIKQVDKDNKYVYSAVRTVNLGGKAVGVHVYPNPMVNEVKVSVDLQKATPVTISISNATGQIVYNQKFNTSTGVNVLPVNVSKYASGTYNVKVAIEGQAAKLVQVVKK